jgi:hypothetical protein
MTTTPITYLLFKALDNYNKAMIETPAKHTIFKALLYTFGTSVLATILYRVLLRRGGSGGGSSRFTFLSVFLKPLQFIFKDLEHNETKIIPFEDKYFNEYDDWQKRQKQQQQQQEQQDTTSATEAEQQHRKECLENMYYSTVRETIDDFYGDVIMCYDHATLSFAYYARTANIPYKYLETISRKYMIETNAPREIHVDIRDEYNKAKNRTATTTTSSSTTSTASSSTASSTASNTASSTATEETPDVFVKLKSYNTASNLNLHTTTNETTNKIHKYVAGTEGPPTGHEGQSTGTAGTAGPAGPAGTTGPAAGTTNKIFREKANRYSYRGKIADFDVNHKTFLADRRATTDTATADTTTAATTADTAAATGYAEFKKQWMTAKSAL